MEHLSCFFVFFVCLCVCVCVCETYIPWSSSSSSTDEEAWSFAASPFIIDHLPYLLQCASDQT